MNFRSRFVFFLPLLVPALTSAAYFSTDPDVQHPKRGQANLTP